MAGSFRTSTGLGQSARLCYLALKAQGMDVKAIDLTDAFMQPLDYSSEDLLFEDSCDGYGTLILHVNAPLIPLALTLLGMNTVANKYVIGYWAWELLTVPPEWKHGVKAVHEIWVPSRFCAESIRSIAEDRVVRVIPHPVLAGPVARKSEQQARGPFTVLTVVNAASSLTRKNPGAALQAFQEAFADDDDCRLILKISHADEAKDLMEFLTKIGGTRVEVIRRLGSSTEVTSLIESADVVLSLHRSEGFGLVMAEAMCAGVPVVATDWSGNSDYLDQSNGIPVPCKMVPARDPQKIYDYPDTFWAEPDTVAAEKALRALKDSPQLREKLGRAAANQAQMLWSSERYARLVRKALHLEIEASI